MNIIWTIGLFTLIFFLLYLLLTWLVKMLMRKKEDSEEPEYVTLDKYEKDIKALKRQIARLEDSLAEQAFYCCALRIFVVVAEQHDAILEDHDGAISFPFVAVEQTIEGKNPTKQIRTRLLRLRIALIADRQIFSTGQLLEHLHTSFVDTQLIA